MSDKTAIDDVGEMALHLGLSLLRWAGVTDSDDNLAVEMEALDAFASAVPESSIPEACAALEPSPSPIDWPS